MDKILITHTIYSTKQNNYNIVYTQLNKHSDSTFRKHTEKANENPHQER